MKDARFPEQLFVGIDAATAGLHGGSLVAQTDANDAVNRAVLDQAQRVGVYELVGVKVLSVTIGDALTHGD